MRKIMDENGDVIKRAAASFTQPEPEPVQKPIIKAVEPEPVPAPVYQKKTEIPEQMTAFKKTILGKVLGTAAKVFIPVAAAVTGVGMIKGITSSVGAVMGVKNSFGGAAKGLSVIGQKAADLVTGTTKEQRDMIREEKAEAKEAKEQIEFAGKLMKAGASEEEAYQKAGIPKDGPSSTTKSGFGPYLIFAALALGLIALIAKLGKKKR
jgi:hypothetical protein